MAGKKDRELEVITRKEGVRKENPLFRVGDKYYPPSDIRTPELREEADALSGYVGSAPDKSTATKDERKQTGSNSTHDGKGNF